MNRRLRARIHLVGPGPADTGWRVAVRRALRGEEWTDSLGEADVVVACGKLLLPLFAGPVWVLAAEPIAAPTWLDVVGHVTSDEWWASARLCRAVESKLRAWLFVWRVRR